MIDEAREWLEAIYAGAGPEADWARELLDQCDEAALTALETERDDLNHMVESFNELLDAQGDADFEGDTPTERLETGLSRWQDRFMEYRSIRELCLDAGLIAPGDGKTSVVLLLRMFLPA